MKSLLPPNATEFEKDLEQALREEFGPPTPADQENGLPYTAREADGKIRALDIAKYFLPQPDENGRKCPEDALPYLANNRSMEIYAALPDADQRAIIATSFDIHRNEGTGQALIDLLGRALGLGFEINDKNVKNVLDGITHWSYFELTFTEPLSKTNNYDKIICALVQEFAPHRSRLVQINHTGTANWKWDYSTQAQRDDPNNPVVTPTYLWADSVIANRPADQDVFTWGVITTEAC